MAVQKSFGQRVLANLMKRWLQVFIAFVAFAIASYVTQRVLGPKEIAKNAVKDPKVYKYLCCSECRFEIPYNTDQENIICPKCKPPKVGYFKAAKESIKNGGDRNPWRMYNIGIAVEATTLLALIYLILSRPIKADPTFYVVNCIHCGLLLKYQPDGVDRFAICAGCDEIIKLPDADEVMTTEDQEQVKESSVILAMESSLIESGHIKPRVLDGEASDEAKTDEPNGSKGK